MNPPPPPPPPQCLWSRSGAGLPTRGIGYMRGPAQAAVASRSPDESAFAVRPGFFDPFGGLVSGKG